MESINESNRKQLIHAFRYGRCIAIPDQIQNARNSINAGYGFFELVASALGFDFREFFGLEWTLRDFNHFSNQYLVSTDRNGP